MALQTGFLPADFSISDEFSRLWFARRRSKFQEMSLIFGAEIVRFSGRAGPRRFPPLSSTLLGPIARTAAPVQQSGHHRGCLSGPLHFFL
jgi:hypothetical protein